MSTTPSPLSVGIISLGCPKNLVDSQIMAGVMLTENITIAAVPEEADVLLVNTCSFIHDAREESINAILEACALRDEGYPRAVVVTGCLPQRYREELAGSLPEVDAFVGLDGLETIATVIRAAVDGRAGAAADAIAPPERLYEPRVPALSLTGGPFAYLKIGEGCNHPCAFCAIPGIRGRHRSRPVDALVAEAEALLEAGVREINLISQDTTSYGRDLPAQTGSGVQQAHVGLAELLRALGRIGGEFWIRVLYGYPSQVSDAVLDAMAEVDQVVPYLDIPIQHSHPDILKAMRRADTCDAVLQLPARVRQRLSDATLRTTCLVGFPGETRMHFDHLLHYIQEARFDHLGAFAFSPEEGTEAEMLPHRPRQATAERRRDKLLSTQQKLVAVRNAALIGQTDVALLEHPSEASDLWVARTPRQAPDVDGVTRVLGVGGDGAAGDFVQVRYTAADGYDLEADVVR